MKYKYLIYKIYSWTAKKQGETPIANAIFALGITHYFQFLTVLLAIDRLLVPIPWMWNLPKTSLIGVTILWFLAYYMLVYNKTRWNAYILEFQDETESEKRKGNFWTILYLVGSILLFFLSLPVLFSLGNK